MIERGELPRNVERLVVGRGRGRHQSDPIRHHGDRRQQRQRLELTGVFRRVAPRLDVRGIASAERVGKEDEIEPAFLGLAREIDIVPQVHAAVRLSLRMAPASEVMTGGIEEGAELHLAAVVVHRSDLVRQ